MNGLLPVPRHVAIIMDGNGRWAHARSLPRARGHVRGANAVRSTVETAVEVGIEYLTLYAFSVANWARPEPEVRALMQLLVDFAGSERANLRKNGVRLNVAGDLDRLPAHTRQAVRELMADTADCRRMTLTLALSYGGRQDILNAARTLVEQAQAGHLQPEDLDEVLFRQAMSTRGLPDVDLLIRTSGECRVSDFLLFECAYAEMFFTPVMWPDFSPAHLREAVASFRAKERRFGKTSEQLCVAAGAPATLTAAGG